jgi:phthiocerol/phenolphthiocerol synthesis type-I polyketide synthase E
MSNTEERMEPEGIAIIGMVCRFPDAKTTDEFWTNLVNGKESISCFSDDELLAAGLNPSALTAPNYVRARAVIDDIDLFDASFFGFSPREAEATDPQQRIFLECAHQALESAGYNPMTYSGPIGVYAGVTTSNYFLHFYSQSDLPDQVGSFQGEIGNDKDFLSTRVSYKLNLKGPSINVNTACSTSLVAVALACQSLLSYQNDIALAGGVSISIPQKLGYFFQEGAINSPDGHCRPFDAKAEGTVGGNGAGIVVLKRLADAIADGDHIHAVIKGAAINNDGAAKVGYTAPSVDGQAKVIGEALAMANVGPESISYMETHGTATPLGDPIEIAALTKVFRAGTARKQFCALGSVKSNIGHLDAAAGVAGLIKTALALEHQLIPASLHYQAPNPKIDFENSPFFVNAAPRAWVRNGSPRRAGVSSFGIGGTNAHLVLEEAPPPPPSGSSRGSQLLVLSAKTAKALAQATQNLAQYLKQNAEAKLADVAYTCAVGRRAFAQRRMVLARDVNEAVAALAGGQPQRVWSRSVEPKFRPVHFLFSGQGSQQVNMGRQLYESQRLYRETVDRCAAMIASESGLDVRQVLYPAAGSEAAARAQLQQTAVTQPALFITEYALVQQWQHWGVKPQGMLGHSLGEFVAACVAGVLSEADALRLVAVRARLMQQMAGGAMLSVALSEAAVRELIRDRVSVAAINGAELTVVAGTTAAIAEVEAEVKAAGIWHRRLETSHAFHSELMEPMLDEYGKAVAQVQLREPPQPYVSSVTGEWIKGSEVQTVDYWVRQVREPVRFWAGLEELKRGGESVVVEVGPGKALTTLARAVWGADAVIVPTLGVAPGEGAGKSTTEEERVSAAVGQAWLGGVEIDWSKYYSEECRARVTLPTYPFERQRYWAEPKKNGRGNTNGNGSKASPHESAAEPAHSDEAQDATSDENQAQTPQTEPADPPRNKGERIIAEVFKELLGIKRLGVHDNFFDMGGHSLLAIQVMRRLSGIFNIKLPPDKLINKPTVAGLAQSIAKPEAHANGKVSPAVPMQTGGSKRPFFCVHPIGGGIFCFRDLVRHLGPEQPFYGMQARELSDISSDGDPYGTLEEMADYYVNAVRGVQPDGPYLLGGFSWGSIVAFEMAQQLARAGEKVPLLVIMDTPSPDIVGKIANFDDTTLLLIIARDLGHQRGLDLPVTFDGLSRLQPDEKFDYVLGELVKGNILTDEVSQTWLRRHIDGYRARMSAVQNYSPGVYPGPITLFRATDLDAEVQERFDVTMQKQLSDPTFGWEKFTTQPVEIHDVPGNHSVIVLEPHVQVLAQQLSACISKTESHRSNNS